MIYTSKYFAGNIFQTNYQALAQAIFDVYKPKTIIEFGCGNGSLAKQFALLSCKIVCTDGFSVPDFEANSKTEFYRLDLNDNEQIKIFKEKVNQRFDLAISFEVAEHLQTASSQNIVNLLTHYSDKIAFSAAVIGQGGEGHINCQPLTFWKKLFEANGFVLIDNIRPQIIENKSIEKWYRFNILSYVKHGLNDFSAENNIENLVKSNSQIATEYYQLDDFVHSQQYKLNLPIVKLVLKIRNFIKRIFGRPTLN